MASGSFNGTYKGFIVRTDWSSTQNVSGNYSTITCNHYLVCDQWSALYISGRTNKCTVNGEEKTFSSEAISTEGNVTIHLGTTTHKVDHNSDGKKTVSASTVFNIRASINNNYVESITANGTMVLDNIPRASSVSGGSGNIGSETTIKITRAVETFKHTLKYEFGSLTGTIATNVETTCKWTIPTSFYAQIKNSNTGKGKIICETYNDKTLMGTSEVEFTANVINSDPTVGTFTYKDTNPVTTEITGNNQRIIRNNSTLLFTIGTATAKNSATISKYEVTFNEVTQSLNSAGTLNFGIINLSSNSKAILKVFDSRGNVTQKEIEVIMDNWEIPKGIVSAKRKNNFYSETILKVDGSYSSLNGKNTMAIQYICRRVDLKESSYDGNLEDNKETVLDLDNNYQWHIQIFVSDRLGQTTYNIYIDRGIPLIFFDRLNENVGINCFPDGKFKLDIDGDANGKNLPVATGINSLSDFDKVGAGEYLYKSGMYSVCVDNVWYNLINVRHRNGYTDGVNYGYQIRSKFKLGSPLEYRQQNNGTWTEWQTIGSTSYSNSETIVGTWVDGKPIYRKSISGTSPTSSVGSIIIQKADKLINHKVHVKRKNEEQYHSTNSKMITTDNGHAEPVYLDSSGHWVVIYIDNTEYQGQPYYGWVEYTKTTD